MPPLLLLLLLGTPTFTFGATCKAGAVRTGVCLQNSMMDVYRNFNASDTSDCCAACAAEPRFCRSWMWYYTEAKGRHDKPGLCFLGRNNTRITKAPRTCDAGVSEVPIPPPCPGDQRHHLPHRHTAMTLVRPLGASDRHIYCTSWLTSELCRALHACANK
jgi:hypothetical protein